MRPDRQSSCPTLQSYPPPILTGTLACHFEVTRFEVLICGNSVAFLNCRFRRAARLFECSSRIRVRSGRIVVHLVCWLGFRPVLDAPALAVNAVRARRGSSSDFPSDWSGALLHVGRASGRLAL